MWEDDTTEESVSRGDCSIGWVIFERIGCLQVMIDIRLVDSSFDRLCARAWDQIHKSVRASGSTSSWRWLKHHQSCRRSSTEERSWRRSWRTWRRTFTSLKPTISRRHARQVSRHRRAFRLKSSVHSSQPFSVKLLRQHHPRMGKLPREHEAEEHRCDAEESEVQPKWSNLLSLLHDISRGKQAVSEL